MAESERQFMGSRGGNIALRMEKSISPEKKEGVVFGLEYLNKKQEKLLREIESLEQSLIRKGQERESYEQGKLTEEGYVVRDTETGEKMVYLSSEFLDRQLEGGGIGNESAEQIIKRFLPVQNNNYLNNLLRECRGNLSVMREDELEIKQSFAGKINKVDYTQPQNLVETINSEKLSYLEIIAVIDRAVKKEEFGLETLKEVFKISNDSRVKLAIVELLPYLFKGIEKEEEILNFLQECVVNISRRKNDEKIAYPYNGDEVYIDHSLMSYEEDPERAIFVHAVFTSLESFEQNAEINLKNIFQRNRNISRREVEKYNLEMADVAIPEMVMDDIGEGDLYYGVDIDKEGDLIDHELKDLEDGYYYENRHILLILKNIGTRKTIDFICNFITSDDDSVYIYKDEIVDILDTIDVKYASSKLYELLQTSDGKVRERVGKVLFRLEVGKIGISQRGVEYLEKVFDLGYLNNPDFFVERMTASGVIGIFDEKGVPENYFKITTDDLLSNAKTIHPKVLKFTVESLFYTDDSESEDEKQLREEVLQEFKENYFDVYIKEFKEKTGVNFNNFELQEQGQFLRYYMRKDEYHRQKLFDFIKKNKEDGLKAFLSLEQGGMEMGKNILKIGNKFENNIGVANAIFRKYGELVDAVENVGDYLREGFEQADPKMTQEIQENLLMRGKAILVMFADEEMAEEEVVERLREINSGVDVLGSVLKAMKDGGENIDFEVIKDLKIEKREVKFKQSLSLVEKEEVLQIFKKSYKKIFSDNPSAYKRVINNIETQLNNLAGQIVYVMKHKDKVVAFCRFKKIGNNEVEGASLVVDEDIQGLNVGGYFVDSTTKDISSEYAIRIKSRKNNPVNGDYQKRGYKIIGEHTEKDGVEYYDMRMPARGEQGLRLAA